jgi:hypothetical protein
MNLYAILRRDGFTDGPTLERAAERSTAAGNNMSDDISWVRPPAFSARSHHVATTASTSLVLLRFNGHLRMSAGLYSIQ